MFFTTAIVPVTTVAPIPTPTAIPAGPDASHPAPETYNQISFLIED